MITYNGADYYDKTGEFGQVKTGQRADLLLLEGNPLSNIENISKVDSVMVGGRLYSKVERSKLLEALKEKHSVKAGSAK